MQTPTAEVVLERMVRAVERVRERLLRATSNLDEAGVPYAVCGDNAVAAWVATVDESAVRNTPEVEILIRRPDLKTARIALEAAGFVYRHSAGRGLFLDGVHANERNSVRILFANERVRPEDALSNPDVDQFVPEPRFRLLNLSPLVMMNLASLRNLNQLRIRDLIDVGLVDRNWLDLLPSDPPELRERLRATLANPDG
jgi:hypothetical protein